MGIRSKILLAFFLCFGTLAGISLHLLRSSISESHDEIERTDIAVDMDRIVQSLESSTDSLRLKTRDWAAWTEMANFVNKPNADWEKENLSLTALEAADVSVGLIYRSNGTLLTSIAPRKFRQELNLPALDVSPYAPVFKEGVREPQCGFINTNAGLMLTCWAGIIRTDHTGDVVGTVVLGRLLDATRINRLRRQTGAPFNINMTSNMPTGLSRWRGRLSANSVGTRDFWTAADPNVYRLYFPLRDLLDEKVGLLTLDVRRRVHEQGERTYRQTRNQLIWVVLLTTMALALTLHFLLIERLRRFSRQLIDLANKSTWQTRIDIKGSDELGLVAGNVNKLLAIIESQVEGLNALSMTDALTDLSNRRAFDLRLAQEYSREQRSGKPLTLLVLDVDHFKQYNDHYGHPAGDIVLQKLGQILRLAEGRASDFAARLGGEEFCILLPETGITGARKVAEHIHQLVREAEIAHATSPIAPNLTVSIGIALAHDEPLEAFVERADQALYHVKHHGRNGTYCVDEK